MTYNSNRTNSQKEKTMSDRIMTCSAALAEALLEEMERDETVFIVEIGRAHV